MSEGEASALERQGKPFKMGGRTDRIHTQVAVEEVGGQLGGFGGAALAGALCLGFRIVTGGIGLFACGVIGGIAGNLAGGAIGGAITSQ
jgi:hypothetical protein